MPRPARSSGRSPATIGSSLRGEMVPCGGGVSDRRDGERPRDTATPLCMPLVTSPPLRKGIGRPVASLHLDWTARIAVQRRNGATRPATTEIRGCVPTNTRTFLLRGRRLDCRNCSRNKGVAVCQLRHVLTSPSAPGSWRMARRREGQSSRVRAHHCRRVTRPRDGGAHGPSFAAIYEQGAVTAEQSDQLGIDAVVVDV
jgi:hypothetical protein